MRSKYLTSLPAFCSANALRGSVKSMCRDATVTIIEMLLPFSTDWMADQRDRPKNHCSGNNRGERRGFVGREIRSAKFEVLNEERRSKFEEPTKCLCRRQSL